MTVDCRPAHRDALTLSLSQRERGRESDGVGPSGRARPAGGGTVFAGPLRLRPLPLGEGRVRASQMGGAGRP